MANVLSVIVVWEEKVSLEKPSLQRYYNRRSDFRNILFHIDFTSLKVEPVEQKTIH